MMQDVGTAPLRRMVVLCLVVLAVERSAVRAEQPPSDDARIAEAKQLFRQGNELRKAGDCERALVLFVRSRMLVESVANVLNAAVCLETLGRFDEALENYEVLLTSHNAQLHDDERASIATAMARLRTRVGSIDVIANTKGALVIDGRPRGTLPLLVPARVLPGSHEIRIIEQGYETFETKVDVAVGKTARVEAKLTPLTAVGKLRVDDPALVGGDVVVDGAAVGTVPWEGPLAPGEHQLVIVKGDVGTAPMRVVVVQGQTSLPAITPMALGPPMRVVARPASAEISLGEVPLGRGSWEGRLPIGSHVVAVSEDGYVTARRAVAVSPEGPHAVEVELQVDKAHPRWGVIRGQIYVEPLAGIGIAGDLGTGAAAACREEGSCTSRSAALGLFAAATGGYEFPKRVSLAVLAGYVRLGQQISRRHDRTVEGNIAARYELEDDVLLHGPVGGLGVGYRRAFGRFELRAQLFAGAMFAFSRNRVRGDVSETDRTLPLVIERSGTVTTALNAFVMPALHLRTRVGGVELGLGLAVSAFLLNGPDHDHGDARPDSTCTTAGTLDCALGQDLADRRAYGQFLVFIPSITAAHAF